MEFGEKSGITAASDSFNKLATIAFFTHFFRRFRLPLSAENGLKILMSLANMNEFYNINKGLIFYSGQSTH